MILDALSSSLRWMTYTLLPYFVKKPASSSAAWEVARGRQSAMRLVHKDTTAAASKPSTVPAAGARLGAQGKRSTSAANGDMHNLTLYEPNVA